MITCEQCGKVTGEGQVGAHWICGDCKEDPVRPHEDAMQTSKPEKEKGAAH